MDKKISFGVDGFSVIDDYSDSQLAIVEIYVCHDGNNLHDMPIDLSVLKKAKKTLKNKFLVAGFDGEDFEGHEPDEQIVGFFPESSVMKFEEKDGKTYLVAQAIMSKVYASWAYNVFLDDGSNARAVSMEITVLGTEIQEDGLEHITKFVFNGVTLLGKSHIPACEGTNASIIKFSKENALQVYSKHFEKNSDKIKKSFVENMKLAEDLGKEEQNNMKEKEKEDVKTVEEELEASKEEKEDVAKDEKKEEKLEVSESSDEDTYMSDESDEKFDEDEDDDKEEDADKKSEEESDEDDDKEEDEEDDKEEDMECNKDFESLTVEQKYEVFRSAVRESFNGSGYLESFDEEFLYVYDYCDGYTYKYAYTLEGTKCTIDNDSKARVMRGGYVDFESYEEESNKMETLEKENCELKEKLAAYETAEKEKSVEAILSEVRDVVPAETVAELREKSANYSLENLSVFENEVKAIAFEAVANQVKESKYSFHKMSVNTELSQKTSKYGW